MKSGYGGETLNFQFLHVQDEMVQSFAIGQSIRIALTLPTEVQVYFLFTAFNNNSSEVIVPSFSFF